MCVVGRSITSTPSITRSGRWSMRAREISPSPQPTSSTLPPSGMIWARWRDRMRTRRLCTTRWWTALSNAFGDSDSVSGSSLILLRRIRFAYRTIVVECSCRIDREKHAILLIEEIRRTMRVEPHQLDVLRAEIVHGPHTSRREIGRVSDETHVRAVAPRVADENHDVIARRARHQIAEVAMIFLSVRGSGTGIRHHARRVRKEYETADEHGEHRVRCY